MDEDATRIDQRLHRGCQLVLTPRRKWNPLELVEDFRAKTVNPRAVPMSAGTSLRRLLDDLADDSAFLIDCSTLPGIFRPTHRTHRVRLWIAIHLLRHRSIIRALPENVTEGQQKILIADKFLSQQRRACRAIRLLLPKKLNRLPREMFFNHL